MERQPAVWFEWQRPSVVALLSVNVLPLLGVLFLGWEVFPLLALFWMENLIVGGFNVLKMIWVTPKDSGATAAKFFLIPFFCVHYGMFTMIHGVFVFGMFGGGMRQGQGFPGWAEVMGVVRQEHLGWIVIGLAISHGISFGLNYLRGGEFRRATLRQLMAQPYGRIVVLHLTILGGGFLMLLLGSPVVGLMLLVALKTVLDLRAHLSERRKFAERAVGEPGSLGREDTVA
jgi:hypothetical protein